MTFTATRDAITGSLLALGAPEYWFNDFDYVVGQTPLSEIWFPVVTTTLFCGGIPLLQWVCEVAKCARANSEQMCGVV